MNWLLWVLLAACCVAGLCVGWTARGYYYEREEETGG